MRVTSCLTVSDFCFDLFSTSSILLVQVLRKYSLDRPEESGEHLRPFGLSRGVRDGSLESLGVSGRTGHISRTFFDH